MENELRDEGMLVGLQRFQSDFDRVCGFDANANAVDQLGGLEFTALALAGEVGEVANLIKKMRRSTWRGGSVEINEEDLAEELADVLAYTMKLANQLDIDLTDAYRRKMHANWLRFAIAPRAVTVMGPPGAGKTTITTLLAARFPAYVEQPDRNPHLEAGWPTRSSALECQRWFLGQVAESVGAARRHEPLVVDQDPRAVVRVYSELMARDGWLEDTDVQRLLMDLQPVEAALAEWRAGWGVVLLDAEPDVLAWRIAKRDGDTSVVDHLAEIKREFAVLSAQLPTVSVVETDNLSPQEVAAAVEEHLHAAA
jgi:NTP pyrophosphatase (non-canonical NTP hydrolase)/deoxyadenosine/deoxycytidine kinase